jgi:thiol-disulfide isomerase/thioredoxin
LSLPVVAGQGERSVGPGEKPLLIEVFASWCETCRRAAPGVSQVYRQHSQEVDFVAVSVDDLPDAAAGAKQSWPIPYPVAHDANRAFSRAYGIKVLPTFILIGQDGLIKKVHHGAASSSRLEGWIASLAH